MPTPPPPASLRKLPAARVEAFQQTVWEYYQASGRHDLPWRKTTDPYHILVSEMMLQQTQVSRVIPKYLAFITAFPTVEALCRAPLRDVLQVWQGLGYNRRALYLQRAACSVAREHEGRFPTDYATLRALPGVGPYTAGAVMAFAYSTGVPVIETNIRTVYLHHFFSRATRVSDRDILKRVEETLVTTAPRDWYYALMDYGAYLKAAHGNNTTKSRHYTKQSRFQGSARQLRGAIVRLLSSEPRATLPAIATACPNFPLAAVEEQLDRLVAEGLLVRHRNAYELPTSYR